MAIVHSLGGDAVGILCEKRGHPVSVCQAVGGGGAGGGGGGGITMATNNTK